MSHSQFKLKFTLTTHTQSHTHDSHSGDSAIRLWLPSALWAEDLFEGHLCGSPSMPGRGRGERPRSGRDTTPTAGQPAAGDPTSPHALRPPRLTLRPPRALCHSPWPLGTTNPELAFYSHFFTSQNRNHQEGQRGQEINSLPGAARGHWRRASSPVPRWPSSSGPGGVVAAGPTSRSRPPVSLELGQASGVPWTMGDRSTSGAVGQRAKAFA